MIWKLGPVTLGDAPRVALSMRGGIARRELEAALAQGVDFLELRVDQSADPTPAGALRELEALEGLPVLGTVRAPFEGGAWQGGEEERLRLFEAILPRVDAVDIEANAVEIAERVADAALEAGKLLIVSYHHFEHTPGLMALEEIDARARRLGAHVVKVAVWCNSQADLRNLASFTIQKQPLGIITIGMGELGVVSRIAFPALGSLVTYACHGTPTAPGQLTWEETVGYLAAFYPQRRNGHRS
jgi:3-dehydroquinate dehydratase-1